MAHDLTPTTFVEVQPPVQPPDGSHYEGWTQTVRCSGCGWLPALEWYLGKIRTKKLIASWEPCPGCGANTLRACTGRPWTDPTRQKFWWELK